MDIISKTHCACQLAGGVTADHYVRRHILHGACTTDFVWVDEISSADVGILYQLNISPTVRFLLSSDFKQFPPL